MPETVSLQPHHQADLARSGLSPETIHAAGLYSASADEVVAILNFDVTVGPGLVIPYNDSYARVKLDRPDANGKRYRSPKGQPNRLYIPPILERSILERPERPLYLIEGEKKALKACQEGLACLAFSGVWSWKTRNKSKGSVPIADLDTIAWQGRPVTIVYDSDIVRKPEVQAAETALANELARRGATVYALRFPAGDQKVGLDDFLVTHGIEAFRALEPIRLADPSAMRGSDMPRSDLGNAQRLVAQHGCTVRYVPQWGKWLVWDGRRWAKDESLDVVRRAKATVRALLDEALREPDGDKRSSLTRFALHSQSEARISGMIQLARSEAGIPCAQDQLDVDPWLLNVLNGTLDLRSGQLCPHRQADLITKLAPVEYDQHASCPTWTSFLYRILGGDEALIRYLQKAVGYSLTGSTREQCLFLLYGAGANGKSTFLNTLSSALGDYGRHTPSESLLIGRSDGVRNDLARLQGARFVTAIEAEGGRRLAEALVKQLTGGDKITARYLYQEHFEFEPTFKIWLAVNHKPLIQGTDHAIWRRIHLVPFDVTIPAAERDKSLVQTLRVELPGILRWSVAGCRLWQGEGLEPPLAMKHATGEYRAEMDLVAAFIQDRCVIRGDGKTRTKQLFAEYTGWCAQRDEVPADRRRFAEALKDHGFTSQRDKHGMIWLGIALQSE